jgi:hypothetical protein
LDTATTAPPAASITSAAATTPTNRGLDW